MHTTLRTRLLTAGVSLAVLAIFSLAAVIEYNRAIEADKQAAMTQLQLSKARIESLLTTRIIGAQGLIVYAQSHPNLTQTTYESFASNLYGKNDGVIRNLAILKDTTILYVYPFKGNESVVGRNLALVPDQRDSVLAVKNSGRMQLVAPVDLVQGGRGIIVRIPIAAGSGQEPDAYWGQVSLVFDYDGLLDKSGLKALSADYQLALTEADPLTGDRHTVWSNVDHPPDAPVTETIHMQQVTWELSIQPNGGWHGATGTFAMLLGLGLFSTLGAGISLQNLMDAKQNLELKVEERTVALTAANHFLEQSLAELEESQADLTEVNDRLNRSLTDLQDAQRQLITSEKLAALGELVAGVAHEINTPLGISVTLSSYITKLHQDLKRQFTTEVITRTDLEEYLEVTGDALGLMDLNLERASSLVTSFKHVAADQATLERRRFSLRDTVQDVLRSLQPKLKNTGFTIGFACAETLEVYSCPGALSQIVTNLVMNSLIHGFAGQSEGQIDIRIVREGADVVMHYADDGAGISAENLPKVFNPFFSTRKADGSTGLGLHIVHNLVTQTLLGHISLHSTPGEGVRFRITFSDLL